MHIKLEIILCLWEKTTKNISQIIPDEYFAFYSALSSIAQFQHSFHSSKNTKYNRINIYTHE